MQAIVLAAGYATRLRPLTDNQAKPLLPIAGRPILEHIVEGMRAVTDIERVYIVTNARFARDFEQWAAAFSYPKPIHVVNDGTSTNETRLGAIGDVLYVLRQYPIDDDLLVLAGDNLYSIDLRDFVRFFRQHGSTVGLFPHPELERVKDYSEARLGKDHRITYFKEKPDDPRTNLVGIALYAIARQDVPLYFEYQRADQNMDAPGYFIEWLYRRTKVSGYVFNGFWYDIGNHESYREADCGYSAYLASRPKEETS